MAKGKRRTKSAGAEATLKPGDIIHVETTGPSAEIAEVVDARPVELVPPMAAPAAKPDPRYSFPWPSRCPRCGSMETERTGTIDNVQYRKCRSGVCRHSYKVMGTKV